MSTFFSQRNLRNLRNLWMLFFLLPRADHNGRRCQSFRRRLHHNLPGLALRLDDCHRQPMKCLSMIRLERFMTDFTSVIDAGNKSRT